MNFNDNRLIRLEEELRKLTDRVDKYPIDKLERKMMSEKDIEFSGGKFQKHLRDYIDIDNKILGKKERGYNAIILRDDNGKDWKITIEINGNLITKQL